MNLEFVLGDTLNITGLLVCWINLIITLNTGYYYKGYEILDRLNCF